MNILQLGEIANLGGASEVTELLKEGLRKSGNFVKNIYSIDFLQSKNNNTSDNIVFFDGTSIFRRPHLLFRKFFEIFALPDFIARIYLFKIIKQYNIQIVQLHAMQNSFLKLCDIKWLSKKIQVVWTLHDTWFFAGGCMCYMECKKWISDNCFDCKLKRHEICSMCKIPSLNLFWKKFFFHETNIQYVAPSEWNKNNLNFSYLNGNKVNVINNGIKENIFYPCSNREQLKIEYGLSKKVLMFMASFSSDPWKGWDLLYTALLSLTAPDEYEVIVAGHASEDVDKLPMHVVKAGYIKDKAELNRLYNAADLFIIPSRQDNFPTVVLESMFAGTPVLGFNVGGIPEQLADGRGWIADELTSDALKNKIEEIFSGDYKARMQKQRIKVAEESRKLYSQDVMVNKYLDLYKRILEM